MPLDIVSHILAYVGKELYHNTYTGSTHIRFSEKHTAYAMLQSVYETYSIYSDHTGHSSYHIHGTWSVMTIDCTIFRPNCIYLWTAINQIVGYNDQFCSHHVAEYAPYQVRNRDNTTKTMMHY